MHIMLRTSITDSSEVPAPPHPAPIVAKTHASAFLPAATSNSVSGPSAILIPVHDALLAQNKDVAATMNGESEGNAGIVSATQGTNISLDVSFVPVVSGVSISAGADTGESTSSVYSWVY